MQQLANNDDEHYGWLLCQSERNDNSFLSKFADACFKADKYNYALLRPIINHLHDKYPLRESQKLQYEQIEE